ncbi:MAG: threonylcarbamoyl-AMP synthase [Roseiflexaceae bacterium]|nr:threonylcarbamoyl-AMP synthase [Roseiflexaceae bacterium]
MLAVDPIAPDPTRIASAAAALLRGELVAFPTETVYGLGANALDARAVARIFAAKERPAADPLIVHVATLDQLASVVAAMPPLAYELARRFWPGPLTLVLPRGQRIPPVVSAGMDSVAVRVPDHPVAFALLKAAGVPVAAPSANRFTRPSPTTAQHVYDDLKQRVEIILDGGPTPIGLESTVLSLVGAQPEVLRPGGVPIEALRAFVPNLVYQPRYLAAEAGAQLAPGMLLKHYAPDAELLLFTGPREAVLAAMHAAATDLLAAGQRVGVMATNQDADTFADLRVRLELLGSLGNLAQIGARLFASLRALEHTQAQTILVRGVEQDGLGLAIWDRLLRATEGRVLRIP